MIHLHQLHTEPDYVDDSMQMFVTYGWPGVQETPGGAASKTWWLSIVMSSVVNHS